MKEDSSKKTKKHDGFAYVFTPKEFCYFVFKKKNCPECGKKMKKIKEYNTVNGSYFNENANGILWDKENVKNYIYKFKCENCGKEFSLKELAEKNNIK